jgi:hypothetical protein
MIRVVTYIGSVQWRVVFQRRTASSYYTSQIGLLKELGYVGNMLLSGFPGCPAGGAI